MHEVRKHHELDARGYAVAIDCEGILSVCCRRRATGKSGSGIQPRHLTEMHTVMQAREGRGPSITEMNAQEEWYARDLSSHSVQIWHLSSIEHAELQSTCGEGWLLTERCCNDTTQLSVPSLTKARQRAHGWVTFSGNSSLHLRAKPLLYLRVLGKQIKCPR